MDNTREQKLVDVTFAVALLMKKNARKFEKQSDIEVAEWVAKQLKDNGFATDPVGSSFGVLKIRNNH